MSHNNNEDPNQNDLTPVTTFFSQILPELGFTQQQIDEKSTIALQLEIFNVRALRLNAQKSPEVLKKFGNTVRIAIVNYFETNSNDPILNNNAISKNEVEALKEYNPALLAGLLKQLNIKDPSLEILQVLQTMTETVPPLADLAKFLHTSLPKKIPLKEQTFSNWAQRVSVPDVTMETVFERSTHVHCENLISFLETSLIAMPPRGPTEDSWHAFWDTIITFPLLKFCPSLKYTRNSNRGTSTSSKRPDLVCTVNGLAVFRSEEKGPDSTADPAEELQDKLHWNYQGLPYVLGYYANEDAVTFVALTPDSQLHKLTPSFNLLQPVDRFRAFVAIRNIASLLPTLAQMFTGKMTLPETEPIHRESGKRIEQNKGFVFKYYPMNLKQSATKLMDYYKKLGNVRFMDHLHTEKTSRTSTVVKLKFSPVGVEVKPRTPGELVIALWCVLCAVKQMHKQNIMHRDIRWPNVLKYSDREAWFLIDLDDACEFPAPKTSRSFNKETHAPEMFSEEFHDSAVDLWSIGYLMKGCRVAKSARLEEMQTKLLQEDPKMRPSVDDCMKIITQEALEISVQLPEK
eukprot:CAMPEP_0168543294 /NCGR_PEP_ID=MMETSP0413-20121227/1807_1 /TAXON_ID=136452 /ORGANISM="Filamoeba nolandi, Strain NC-AS-23-1" /LENGTH=572 /DNA_ID=CAMNT_0008573233 /DNA_START=50 /DNA_END=1768 /DNA_ORIENTATION=-